MTADAPYRFEPLAAEHQAAFKTMIAEPHVREWWGDDDMEWRLAREGEASGGSRGFCAFKGDVFFGYVQAWVPNWNRENVDAEPWQAAMPEGTRGIDITLASGALGHGAKIIRAFCDKLFDEGVERLTIDPDPANARAIRAYEKAGFRTYDETYRNSHSVLLMELLPSWLTPRP